MFTILRESKIVIEYGMYPLLHLDTIKEFSAEQTFKENSFGRKTLHSNKMFLKHRIIRAKNTISGTMTLHLTRTGSELLLFEIAGWLHQGRTLMYPDSNSVRPEVFNIYVIHPNGSYKLSDCIITNIDMSLNRTFVGELTIGFDSSNMDRIEYPTFSYNTKVQGNHLIPSYISSSFGINNPSGSNHITSAGMSFSRDLTYLNSETIHNSSSLALSNRCTITDMNFNLTVQSYNTNIVMDICDKVSIGQSNINIKMNNSQIIKRDSIGEVVISTYDITPTHKTTSITLQY